MGGKAKAKSLITLTLGGDRETGLEGDDDDDDDDAHKASETVLDKVDDDDDASCNRLNDNLKGGEENLDAGPHSFADANTEEPFDVEVKAVSEASAEKTAAASETSTKAVSQATSRKTTARPAVHSGRQKKKK